MLSVQLIYKFVYFSVQNLSLLPVRIKIRPILHVGSLLKIAGIVGLAPIWLTHARNCLLIRHFST